jgi:excisionase family DNA binding protein
MRNEADRSVDQLMSVEALANHLGVPENTIYQWNHKGTGPIPIRVGKHVRYRSADVARWLDDRAMPRAAS